MKKLALSLLVALGSFTVSASVFALPSQGLSAGAENIICPYVATVNGVSRCGPAQLDFPPEWVSQPVRIDTLPKNGYQSGIICPYIASNNDCNGPLRVDKDIFSGWDY